MVISVRNMDRIKDVVRDRVEDLSPAERRCARALLADYPGAGLIAASALGKSAGTSTPTVLRFVARLGFGSYGDFQQRLRDEIRQDITSPVQRAARGRRQRKEISQFSTTVRHRVELAGQLTSSVPRSEFEAAVRLLAGRPRSVLIMGGYFTRHFAALLASQLDQIMPRVMFTPDPLTFDINRYLALRKDGVAVVFDFRRYEETATRVAQMVQAQGARLVVVTDHELSPAAQFADVVLPVPVSGIPFDSDAGLLILVESLVEWVFLELGQAGIDRMKAWEDAVEVPRVFPDADSIET